MRFCFSVLACGIFALAAWADAGLGAPAKRVTSLVRVDRRTGRLVRFVAVTPAGKPATATLAGDRRVAEVVEQAAERYALDPLLVHSVIQAESNYYPLALSPKGAQGLMQLMPSTARRFGVTSSFDFAENIEGGVRYLRYLVDLFRDEKLALAAYNAGEQAVIRHGGVPPYAETQSYVRAVSGKYASAKQAATAGKQPAKPAEPFYRPIEQFMDQQGNLHVRTR